MFVHCGNCNWGQDDFWSPTDENGWHPFRDHTIENWKKIFDRGLKKEKIQMEIIWAKEHDVPYKEANGFAVIDFRDYLAFELARRAESIESMHWPTHEDFKNDSNQVCPDCGSNDLSID